MALTTASSTPIDANPLPTAVAFSPDGRYAYVANNQGVSNSVQRPGYVTKIDTVNNSIVATIPILAEGENFNSAFDHANASWIAVDPTGAFAYLPDGYGKFSVIDLRENRFLTSFQPYPNDQAGHNPLRGPRQIVFATGKNLAYLATQDSVVVVETIRHTIVVSIPIRHFENTVGEYSAPDVTALAISANGNSLFVADSQGSKSLSLQVFDVSDLNANTATPGSTLLLEPSELHLITPHDLTIDYWFTSLVVNRDLSKIYIASGNTSILLEYDLTTNGLREFLVGGYTLPENRIYAGGQVTNIGVLALSPDGRTLVTANTNYNTATIFDLSGQSASRTVNVGLKPASAVISSDSKYAWVINSESATGSVSKVQIIPTPDAPSQVVATGTSSTSASINFTAPALNGEVVTGYEYSTDGGTTWLPVTPAVTAAPIVISGLNPGTTYTLRVHALSASGAGASSPDISVTTPAQVIPPSVPDSVPVVTPEVVVPPVVEKIWIHKLPILPKQVVKGKALTVSAASSAKAFVTTRSLTSKICKVTKVTKLVKKPRTRAKVRIITGYKVTTKSTGTCLLKSSAPAIGLYPAVQLTSRLVVAKVAKK